MTATRAIWDIVAFAGVSLACFSLASAQTAPQNTPESPTGIIAVPNSEAESSSSGQSQKATIRNTTSEKKAAERPSVEDKTGDLAETSAETTSSTRPQPITEPETAVKATGKATPPPVDTITTTQNALSTEPASKPALPEAAGAESSELSTANPGQLAPSDTETGGEPVTAQPATGTETGVETGAEVQHAEPAPVRIDPKDVKLSIATWAGAYGQSQDRAFFKPFASETGYQLETVIYDGIYDAFEGQAADPEWSLVDLNADDMIRACNDQKLERLDQGILAAAPNGAAPADDFLPGAIHPCGIASVAWSAVLVVDNRLEHRPASLKDFFDTGTFPGKRLLPKQPRYSLELALMADGVAPESVYTTLKTLEGQNRAFAKLSSIKDDIIWWEKPSDVLGRIVNNEAIMGVAFNGRAFMSIVASEQPLDILWDHQIYSYDYWSIPKGAQFQDAAKEFIRFATGTKPLAEQAQWLPYGPARRSAAAIVGKHPELGIDMSRFIPTHAPNFTTALGLDSEFWASNETVLTARFEDWVQGRQLPPQKNALVSQ